MMRTGWIFAALFMFSACVSVEHDHSDHEHRPPPGSNQMLRAPITISDDLEVIIADVIIPAGATVPRHYHPGEEFLYVIEGSAIHVEGGKPDQILKAGDAYVIPPEAEHAPAAAPMAPERSYFASTKMACPNASISGSLAQSQTIATWVCR